MANDPCCNSFGGRITITAGKRKLIARGDITLRPARRATTGEANQDGSAYYTSQNKLVGGECPFSEICGGDWDELLLECTVNITVKEEDNNRTHLFTGTRIVGEPSVNLSTGEVSGLSWAGGTYKKI